MKNNQFLLLILAGVALWYFRKQDLTNKPIPQGGLLTPPGEWLTWDV